MKKIQKNNKGITLVALVITIIILLILAGITINSLTGSGLFKKAELAKEETLIAQYKEKIELIKTETRLSYNGEITLERLNTAFNDSKQRDWVNESIEDKNINKIKLTTNDGFIFYITDGTIEYKGTGDVTIPEIITAEMVEFIPSDNTWKAKDGTEITNVKQALDYLYDN
ncbi:MAG: hypothetical protein HFJ60_06635 [Clostridia bacterium]|jgi:type II secretory pathway pseudopilin PulG|nr:hypothetical protein [Clostridia bacterium]